MSEPHHYRLFVTALVSDKKKKFNQDELEEKESLPVTTLFSENVKDSFSIFVSLPKDYAKKKNQNFPVIYLLDANVYFDIIADAMNEIHSKAILVGIGYKDFVMMDSLRNRDYEIVFRSVVVLSIFYSLSKMKSYPILTKHIGRKPITEP